MELALPIWIEEQPEQQGGQGRWKVRLLDVPQLNRSSDLLERALARLKGDVRRWLPELLRERRREPLARIVSSPAWEDRRVEVFLPLKPPVRGTFTVLTFEAGGVVLGRLPSVDDLWFTMSPGAGLESRLQEVLHSHFRDLAKERGHLKGVQVGEPGKVWLGWLEMVQGLSPVARHKEAKASDLLSLFGGGGKMEGRSELARVGRRLDTLPPEELPRARFREALRARVARALGSPDRHPVLLLGEPGSGRRTLLSDYVARHRSHRGKLERSIWSLSPQRLIAGMSFVGQWEERVRVILDLAQEKQLLLVFEDLLGLRRAGRTSQSQLAVADLLKPRLQQRQVRVAGVITPAAWRRLREEDRGLADAFEVIRVPTPDPVQTRRMLIGRIRALEAAHQVEFTVEALPSLLSLERRRAGQGALLGRAAGSLERLAKLHADPEAKTPPTIGRPQVLARMQASTGLPEAFLDRRLRFDVADFAQRLGARVVGQPHAVEAVTEAVSVARAELAAPGRPLGCFLLVGPTGVGKTALARALAAELFGEEERLLRFDMNEYLDPLAASRLVGDMRRPEGLLTSAIRRQPFSVVLFDEIEKADRGVHDLLLALMGEGRLTDAAGQTADFSASIVLLTSNLGVTEARSRVGFGSLAGADLERAFRRAAERHFRPEFFGRLDAVLPFRSLERSDVAGIARREMDALLAREGLVRRRVVLSVAPAAMEQVIDEGFDPQLGARALKRALERRLGQPVARFLAAEVSALPLLIELLAGPAGILTRVRALREQGAAAEVGSPALPELRARVERLKAELSAEAPDGALDPSALTDGQRRYLLGRALLADIEDRLRPFEDEVEFGVHTDGRLMPQLRRARSAARWARRSWRSSQFSGHILQDLMAGHDARQALLDMAEAASPLTPDDAQRSAVHFRLGVLESLSRSGGQESACWVWLRPLGGTAVGGGAQEGEPGDARGDAGTWLQARMVKALTGGEERAFGGLEPLLGQEMPDCGLPGRALLVEGWLPLEGWQGVHLVVDEAGQLWPVVVSLCRVEAGAERVAALARQARAAAEWKEGVRRGTASLAEDPWPLGPVVMIHQKAGGSWDLARTLVLSGGGDEAVVQALRGGMGQAGRA